MIRRLIALSSVLVIISTVGCGSVDYADMENYYRGAPRSVVVLPVRNESTEAEAGRFFLSTVAKPLANRGYYVLPVEVTSTIFAQEGILDEGLAWEVEPGRLAEYFGADAALYVTIREWDTSYLVITSSVTVAIDYRLVDCRTGSTIWERHARQTVSSRSHGAQPGLAGLVVVLVANAIDAAVTAAATDYVPLASKANHDAFGKLPPGIYHPGYSELQETIATWRVRQNAQGE